MSPLCVRFRLEARVTAPVDVFRQILSLDEGNETVVITGTRSVPGYPKAARQRCAALGAPAAGIARPPSPRTKPIDSRGSGATPRPGATVRSHRPDVPPALWAHVGELAQALGRDLVVLSQARGHRRLCPRSTVIPALPRLPPDRSCQGAVAIVPLPVYVLRRRPAWPSCRQSTWHDGHAAPAPACDPVFGVLVSGSRSAKCCPGCCVFSRSQSFFRVGYCIAFNVVQQCFL